MRRITDVNPAVRSHMRGGNPAVPVRGAGEAIFADKEVRFFIWFISAMSLGFLWLLGGALMFVFGLCVLPFAGGIAVMLSKMGGKLLWAWSIASVYCLCCFLSICLVVGA